VPRLERQLTIFTSIQDATYLGMNPAFDIVRLTHTNFQLREAIEHV
jgi:hypothetical protein